MISDARHGRFEVVMVWACDRIARSTRHFLAVLDDLIRTDVEFISFREQIDTDGPLGRAIVIIIAAIAELERSLIVSAARASDRSPEDVASRRPQYNAPFGKLHDQPLFRRATKGVSKPARQTPQNKQPDLINPAVTKTVGSDTAPPDFGERLGRKDPRLITSAKPTCTGVIRQRSRKGRIGTDSS